MERNRPHQIIATLGPATKKKIDELIIAGATGFRLNCSHLTLQELSRWLINLEKSFKKSNDTLPVWLDLQGAKLRIGKLNRRCLLDKGDVVKFKNYYRQSSEAIPLPHPWVFNKVQQNDEIFLDDGKLKLKVFDVGNMKFSAQVLTPGKLNSFKGFVFKNRQPEFTEVSNRDRSFIEQTLEFENVGYAISYLENAEELQLFKKIAGTKPLSAKIERARTFYNLKQIGDTADVSWLCRGDLGVNAQLYELFQLEKDFAEQMGQTGKPYLIAGQVLENMVKNNIPSRSEIAHLGFLFEHGFSGVVLSDETAIGEFPIEAVAFCREYFDYIAQ